MEGLPVVNYEANSKVLVIEDNPGDARLVEIYLTESDLIDCEVVNKRSLADGIAAMRESDYDVVLLDLTLPDSRGFKTLDTLIATYPDANIIVMTGLDDKDMGVRAVKAGAQDFLVKSEFNEQQLSRALKYSIERSTVRKRLEEAQQIAHIGNFEFIVGHPDSLVLSGEVYSIFGLPTVGKHLQLDDPGHPFLQIYPLIESVVEKGQVRCDGSIVRQDGSTAHVYVQAHVIKRLKHDDLAVRGIIQDISERKLAEQESRRSQERYQLIFSQTRDPFVICQADGQLEEVNPAAEIMFGLSREALLRSNLHDLVLRHTLGGQQLSELIGQRQRVIDHELDIVRGDGERRICLVNIDFLQAGGFEGYYSIIRDVTEQRQAEALRKARDVAEQANQLKEQFLASVSHEMRTPMNAILGLSHLLLQTTLDEEQQSLINSIHQSSRNLLGIINDILEIATLQNGQIEFENKPFDLYELLNNLVHVIEYKLKEKQVHFFLDIRPEVPRVVIGDRTRLNQVLINLAGNAAKFTHEGQVRVLVENTSPPGRMACRLKFSVEDTGIGIPEDKVDVIFETFTRIKHKDRLYEGNGLGLSIARNLVTQQNGHIGVHSKLGQGSTFFFELPFTVGNAQKDLQKPKNNLYVIDPKRDIQLLLVEDHKLNQLVAQKTITKAYPNIVVSIAENGQEAIRMLGEKRYDIVLMDLQMPVMDGYEAASHIREHMAEQVGSTPILAMTAHAHIAKDNRFASHGFDDYVLKPFEPEQLFEKLAKYLNP